MSQPSLNGVQNVQAVQAVQAPSLVLPRVAGEETVGVLFFKCLTGDDR
jgi:hypothetical protein